MVGLNVKYMCCFCFDTIYGDYKAIEEFLLPFGSGGHGKLRYLCADCRKKVADKIRIVQDEVRPKTKQELDDKHRAFREYDSLEYEKRLERLFDEYMMEGCA